MREGLRARSAFKLEELINKYHLLDGAQIVIDLGAWPGGWSVVASRYARVVAVDLRELAPIEGVEALQADLFDDALIGRLPEADAILCDAAPATTGRGDDAEVQLTLARRAWLIAQQRLRPDGSFVCKAFQGEGFELLLRELRPHFRLLKATKPVSSRKSSREMYLVGLGYRA